MSPRSQMSSHMWGKRGVAVVLSLCMIAAVVVVLLPGVITSSPSTFFFITADLSALQPDVIAKLHVDQTTATALAEGEAVSVGLWNACAIRAGSYGCSASSFSYVFDPATLWSDNGSYSPANLVFPPKLVIELESHAVATIYIKLMLILGAGLSLAHALISFIISCVPQGRRTLVTGLTMASALVAALLVFTGAVLATRGYVSLAKSLDASFDTLITFSVGTGAFMFLWLAVLLSVVAAGFDFATRRKEALFQRRRGSIPVEVVDAGKSKWQKNAYSLVVESADDGREPLREAEKPDQDIRPLLLVHETAYDSPARYEQD